VRCARIQPVRRPMRFQSDLGEPKIPTSSGRVWSLECEGG
jgi:hypothetical protein